MGVHGIISYGAYIPRGCLLRSSIAEFTGKGSNKGARSVASYDENTTTMGVEAARNALKDSETDPKKLWFSTVLPAYMDKTNATNIHSALQLDDFVEAVDFGNSTRSAIGALTNALESDLSTLVVTADLRAGPSGGTEESSGGDASTALLIGTDKQGVLLAEYLGGVTVTSDFTDRWRVPGSSYSQVWEERFGEQAYKPLVDRAWNEALKKVDIKTEDITVALISGLHSRAVARSIPLLDVEVADDLTEQIGNTGAAHPSLLLANFLDQAKPGEVVALIVLADGCDVLFFRATQEVENRRNSVPISEQIENQSPVPYNKYLSWRGLLDSQLPNRPSPTRPSSSASMRRNDWKMGFVASKDITTGIVHMPPSRIGIKGGNVDDMEQLPMADSIGTIETFTVDNLVYSPNSPVVFAVVNFQDGGRLPVELTDADPEKIEIGDRVEMTFRCLYTADGIHNYFWKARPVRREREKS